MLLEFIEPREPELKKRYTSRQINALKDEFALFVYTIIKRGDEGIWYIYYWIRTVDAQILIKRIEWNRGYYGSPRRRHGVAWDVSSIKRWRLYYPIWDTWVIPQTDIEIAIAQYINEKYWTEKAIYDRLKETHKQPDVNTTEK